MRDLIRLAVRRQVSVLMCALAVVAFGLVAYQRLAVELFPNLTYPSLTVRTELPDAAPPEVETMLTRPVEEAVGVLQGLERLHSVSRPGLSEVSLEFAWGSDMTSRVMDVREKLDRLILPADSEDPIVLRYDPSLEPVARLALLGPDPLTTVRRIAELKIKPDLETTPGIAAAQLRGGLEEEIRVELDQERMAALGIPLSRVGATLEASNINQPGGALRGKDRQFLIRTLNEYDSVEEIRDLIVTEEEGRKVRLRDIARVYRGAREREEITRVDGQEAVELAVFKEGDANSVLAVEALMGRVAEWQSKLPEGYELRTLFDQSRFIRSAVEEVRDATLIGGALAVLVLLLFLRDFGSTAIIATAIPLSIVATFLMMYRMDISLNIMSLGGLTLGVGMLVDNAIVVLEAIHRRRQAGDSRVRAAIEGAAEVGPAVVASTGTTIAVFLPIVFVEGIAGQMFEDQALTVAMSLVASLVVAVTMIPMLSAQGGGVERRALEVTPEDTPTATLGAFSRGYDALLRGTLRRPAAMLILAGGLFGGAIYALPHLRTELIPRLSSGEFHFELKLPEGTALAATDRQVQAMEAEVRQRPEIEIYYASVGRRQAPGGISISEGENLAQLDIRLADRTSPELEDEVAQALRDAFADLPDAQVRLGHPTYFSLQTPIEVAIFGEDLSALRAYSLAFADRLAGLPGFVDVRSSLEAGNPELQVHFDRERISQLGLELGPLSNALRDRVLGVVPTRFKESDRQIDIRVLNQEADRDSISDVRQLVLPGASATPSPPERPSAAPGSIPERARPINAPVRLLSVARLAPAVGPAEIHRLQQQRAALVTANLDGPSLGRAVRQVEAELASFPPPGAAMHAEIAGQNREMQVSFQSLRFAVALAIFLVYLVMASTF
ncbi:MAG: efflux RND transporter permease subunit, partial [Myxococcota bacterium]